MDLQCKYGTKFNNYSMMRSCLNLTFRLGTEYCSSLENSSFMVDVILKQVLAAFINTSALESYTTFRKVENSLLYQLS